MEIKELFYKDMNNDILKNFNRYQEIAKCWRKENDSWILKDVYYIDDWDNNEKLDRIISMRENVQNGHARFFAAFIDGEIVGFSYLRTNLFGKHNEYMNLGKFHISKDFRNQGIGKSLFKITCSAAKSMGAEKLYISAHSAEEPMAFYRNIGCTDAVEINHELADDEPFDCQLEYIL